MSEDGPSPTFEDAERLLVDVLRHGGAWDDGVVSDAGVIRAARVAFAVGAPATAYPSEVAIVLTDNEEMRTLNRTWRDKDTPTNVLSFPAGKTPCDDCALGDIVIAFETARAEAGQAGITLIDHVSHLVVHGVLHLLGFDHIDDAQAEKMEDLERTALAALNIADPYKLRHESRLAELSQ